MFQGAGTMANSRRAPQAIPMNKAIAAMLGVTGGVLGGFGSLIFVLRKRAKNYSDKIQSKQRKEEE